MFPILVNGKTYFFFTWMLIVTLLKKDACVKNSTIYNMCFELKVTNFGGNRITQKPLWEWRKIFKKKKLIPKQWKLHMDTNVISCILRKLQDWVQMSLWSGFMITRTNIRIDALNLIKYLNFLLFKLANFVGTVSCCNQFMSRCGLCIRTRTKYTYYLCIRNCTHSPLSPPKKNIYIRNN